MMAVDTPKGQQALVSEARVADVFTSRFEARNLKAGKSAIIDRIIVRDDQIVACAELKIRSITKDKYGSLLLSKNKIKAGIEASAIWNIPFLVVVGYVDGSIGYWKVTDDTGRVLLSLKKSEVVTPSSINREKERIDTCYFLDNKNRKML